MNEEQKEAIEYLKTRLYGNEGCKYIDVAQEDLRIFINLIDSLQKENEELKAENEYNKLLLDTNNNFTIDKKTGNYKWNVIEIQKIKDKIEELNKAYEDSKDENGESEYYYPDYTIRVLEELLESE